MSKIFPPDVQAYLDKAVSWSVEFNEHRCVYQSAKDFLLEHADRNDITPEKIQKATDTDRIVQLRVYPVTPVGQYVFVGPDLESVTADIEKFLEEEG